MPRDFSRSERVAGTIRRELAQLIQLELKDPNVGFVSLSDVEGSRDLAHARVFVTVFDPTLRSTSAKAAAAFRQAGVSTELYLADGRLKSQFKHANARGYPWVVVIGPDEAEAGQVNLKSFATGEQIRCTLQEAVARVVS